MSPSIHLNTFRNDMGSSRMMNIACPEADKNSTTRKSHLDKSFTVISLRITMKGPNVAFTR